MDVFGIIYIIENAQQFWSELEEILQVPTDALLSYLDSALKRFVSFCATYHDQYLQTPIQFEHACNLLLNSELFAFHSERMSEQLLHDAETTTDPHSQYVLYKILLLFGRLHSSFLRTHKKWQPLVPLLMDHILLEFDPDVEDNYAGSASGSGWSRGLAAPIEARLRLLAVGLLYELCRLQTLTLADLRIFDDTFIDHLFELVEQTRHMHDETLNYSVIKLIVALNEQFMRALLNPNERPSINGTNFQATQPSTEENRILLVLMRRLGSSKTFGENIIFMLNRANGTKEDLVMQLLFLKILYLLFTTKGTSEYFYTNDLCVLLDVFLRELGDLDEENESLRHTYLRVLHPLLTRTQLRTNPYKRQQIVRLLESLTSNPNIREISSTTKRLVDRCLSCEWCQQLRVVDKVRDDPSRVTSPSNDSIASATRSEVIPSTLTDSAAKGKAKALKATRSAEHLSAAAAAPKPKSHPHALECVQQKSGIESSLSLMSIAGAMPAAGPSSPLLSQRRRATGSSEPPPSSDTTTKRSVNVAPLGKAPDTIVVSQQPHSAPSSKKVFPQHRKPPPPPKRRKPPAIPTSRTGATITTIASSTTSAGPSPLSRVHHAMPS